MNKNGDQRRINRVEKEIQVTVMKNHFAKVLVTEQNGLLTDLHRSEEKEIQVIAMKALRLIVALGC